SRKVRFLSTSAPDGSPAMLTFTDVESLSAWRPAGCDCVAMAARVVCKLAAEQGMSVVVNPKGPGRWLTRADVAGLADGAIPGMTVDGVQTMQMVKKSLAITAPPAPLEPGIHAAVQEALGAQHGVVAAWTVGMTIDGAKPRLVIALQLAEGT